MSNEPTAFEQEMERQNNSVITLKNIDDESFTHPYGGHAYTIEAGETLPFSFRVGKVLAKHLAMRMARKDARKKGKMEGNDDKKSVNLYSQQSLQPYLDKIVVGTAERPLPPRQNEADREQQRTAEIQKNFKEKQGAPTVDKRKVVAELKRRGVKFNPREGIEKLLELLKESEMRGGN